MCLIFYYLDNNLNKKILFVTIVKLFSSPKNTRGY